MDGVGAHLFSPVIQCGFAGMSAVLMLFIFWQSRKLMDLMDKSNKVIAENTAAFRDLVNSLANQAEAQKSTLRLMQEINNKLLARPCIGSREGN